MPEIKTINDVVAALEAILSDCIRTQNRAGYFAALYKRMTAAVSAGIANGQFEDGKRMEMLDVVFAQRYLSAYEAFGQKRTCSDSWTGTFTGCADTSLTVLQQLMLGINTHINLDLAIAAAAVAPGESIYALESDFNKINGVIASLFDDVQQCLTGVWFPMRFLKNVINKQGNAVLNFSIERARNTSWANAVLLANMNPSQQAAHIQAMDSLVRKIGDGIMHPGFWPQLILRLVRMTEYDDVARTIRLIDTTIVD